MISIYGNRGPVVPARTTPQTQVRDQTRLPGQPATSAPLATPTPAARPAVANPAAQPIPAEAPAGTDPALWSVLSGEERAFFAKAGAMGPLTYGRAFEQMKAQQLPANRGGRLDIKI